MKRKITHPELSVAEIIKYSIEYQVYAGRFCKGTPNTGYRAWIRHNATNYEDRLKRHPDLDSAEEKTAYHQLIVSLWPELNPE